MTSEQTQDTRTEVPSELKEQLFTAASQVIHDPEFLDSMIPDVDLVNAILDALTAAGYTIAGPGQYVIDGGETLRLALKNVCCDRLPGTELRHVDRLVSDLMDALPTQEGE
jgi:hypothetical protein